MTYLIIFISISLFVYSFRRTTDMVQIPIGNILWSDARLGHKISALVRLTVLSIVLIVPLITERFFYHVSEVWRKSYIDQWWAYYTGKFDDIKNNPDHKEAFDIVQGVVYDIYPSLSGYEKFMFGRLIRAIGRKSGIEIQLEKEIIPTAPFVEQLWEVIGNKDESRNGWKFLPDVSDGDVKELMSPSGVVYTCVIDEDGCVEKVEKL